MNITTVPVEASKEVWKELVTFVQLAYGIPSVILMVYLFHLFCRYKDFDNSFYKIVKFDFSMNLLCWLNTWFAIRIITFPFGLDLCYIIEKTAPGFLTCTKYLTSVFMHIQFFSAAMLQMHRISVYLSLMRYDEFWKRRFWWMVALAAVTISLISVLFFPHFIIESEIQNGVLVRMVDYENKAGVDYTICLFSSVYFVIMFLLGFCLLMSAYKLSSRMMSFSSCFANSTWKLAVLASISCALFGFLMLWGVFNYCVSGSEYFKSFAGINMTLLTFFSDVATLALPYTLFMLDTNVRRKLRRKPRTVRVAPQINSIVSSNTTSN